MIKEHLKLLGKPAKDLVTGFSGVVSSLSFDLYGCIQVVITPEVDKKGEIPAGQWFDIARVKVTRVKRVMELPDYISGYIAEGKKGAAILPAPK